MSRLVNRKITVTLSDDKPHAFVDRGELHMVETIIDRWQEAGAWWEDESARTVYRLRTSHSGMYDIEHQDDVWRIYRVWD